jgi:HEAT repeat protein
MAGSHTLADLQAALTSRDPARRMAAIQAAGSAPGVEQVLIAALADSNELVRVAAIRALAPLNEPKGVRALIRAAAQDPSPRVRAEAMAGLGRILEARTRGGH